MDAPSGDRARASPRERAAEQDGGTLVLRASEPQCTARSCASRAARILGQVRGEQGEGHGTATPLPPRLVRLGLIRLLELLSLLCMRSAGLVGSEPGDPSTAATAGDGDEAGGLEAACPRVCSETVE